MRLARGLTLALWLLGPASAAQAATVGLADQQPAAYADPRAQALGLRCSSSAGATATAATATTRHGRKVRAHRRHVRS